MFSNKNEIPLSKIHIIAVVSFNSTANQMHNVSTNETTLEEIAITDVKNNL